MSIKVIGTLLFEKEKLFTLNSHFMEKNEILSNINSTKFWHFGPDLMFKVFLLIFDYFTYFNKNIELNLPKRKKIQKVAISSFIKLFLAYSHQHNEGG